MKQDLIKLCADSLRSFTLNKYGIKLKAAHAHELGAAYSGYLSKNAMLADTMYPISNLNQAKIIVMVPDAFIDERRKQLEGLSPDLPDSYTLGEAFYAPLFSKDHWSSAFPPFRTFLSLAKFMSEERGLIESGHLYGVPRHHLWDVKDSNECVLLTVKHAYKADNGNMHVDAVSKVRLPRIAGRIGYGLAHISEERGIDSIREVLAPNAA